MKFALESLPLTMYNVLMTLDTMIMLAGAFVLLEPQLGFPTRWDDIILSILGVVVIGLGIAVRRRGYQKKTDSVQG